MVAFVTVVDFVVFIVIVVVFCFCEDGEEAVEGVRRKGFLLTDSGCGEGRGEGLMSSLTEGLRVTLGEVGVPSPLPPLPPPPARFLLGSSFSQGMTMTGRDRDKIEPFSRATGDSGQSEKQTKSTLCDEVDGGWEENGSRGRSEDVVSSGEKFQSGVGLEEDEEEEEEDAAGAVWIEETDVDIFSCFNAPYKLAA